jgi:hypothetical protein
MTERIAPLTGVPDVVGLPFHIGRDVAFGARVALANPDPDGPSIASIAWPGLFYIVSQEPAPGTQVHEWDSVAIEVIAHGDAPDRQPAKPLRVSPADSARATPQREEHVDLDDGERGLAGEAAEAMPAGDLHPDDAPTIADPAALDEYGRDAQGDVLMLTRPSCWSAPSRVADDAQACDSGNLPSRS